MIGRDLRPFTGSLVLVDRPEVDLLATSSADTTRLFASATLRLVAYCGASVLLPRPEWAIFVSVFSRPGEKVSSADMIAALYADRLGGAPPSAPGCLRRHVFHLRQFLAPLGLTLAVPEQNFIIAAHRPAEPIERAA